MVMIEKSYSPEWGRGISSMGVEKSIEEKGRK